MDTLEELAKIPGVIVTRNAAGAIESVEYSSPAIIEVDPFLEKPAWPKTIIYKAGRGGAREGAGRKPALDKRGILSCRVKQTTLQLLQETAKETGTGLGAVVDFIVEDYKRRTDSE